MLKVFRISYQDLLGFGNIMNPIGLDAKKKRQLMAFPFRVLLQVVLSLFSWFFDAYWLILTSNKFFFFDFCRLPFLCLEVVICRYFEPFLFLLDELPWWIINRRLWWLLSGTIVVGGRVIFLDWFDIKNWPELFACLKTIGPPQKAQIMRF